MMMHLSRSCIAPAILSVVLLTAGCEPPGEAPAEAPPIEDRAETTLDPPQEAPVAAMIVDNTQRLQVRVTPEGFEPSSVSLEPRIEAVIEFISTAPGACDHPIEVPVLGLITESLADQRVVELSFRPSETGVFQFICGTDKMRGRLLVKP